MRKPFLILFGVLVVGIACVSVYYFSAAPAEHPRACTTEAKICPDGSAVGRTGPDCAFATCPAVATTTPNDGGGQGIAPFKSGIRGVVTLGPTCPVVQNPPNPACADKPYTTSITIYHAGVDKPFIIGTSDASGIFSYALPPGDYKVTAGSGKVLPHCASVSVTVSPEDYATTTIVCDTGIR